MDNILITGANGFLGSHLTDFLINKKFIVYASVKPGKLLINLNQYTLGKEVFSKNEKKKIFGDFIQIPTNNDNLKIFECDLRNKIQIEKIIKEIKPRFIYHFGAQSQVIPSWEDPIYTFQTNVIGTINIFESIKKYKINSKVIIACSSAEYGLSTNINRPLKEKDPLLAIHPYGISKVATELLARQYFINFRINSVMLRFFNQTGNRKVGDASSDFIKPIAEIENGLKEPIIEVGNLNTYRDITGIKDSLQAIWLSSTKGKPGETYNVCSNKKVLIRDVLNIALSFSTKNIKVIERTSSKLRITDEDIIIGDNSKIRNELGFKITQSLEELLEDMFEYWMNYYRNIKK